MNDEVSSIGWWGREPLANVLQSFLVYSSLSALQWVFAFEESRPWTVNPVLELDMGFLAGIFKGFLADLLVFLGYFLDLLGGDHSFLDELLGVLVHQRLGGADFAVHKGLGEHGLVHFVVTVATVADQIDDYVLVEGSSPFGSQVTNMVDTFRIIGVYVEDWCVYYTGNI